LPESRFYDLRLIGKKSIKAALSSGTSTAAIERIRPINSNVHSIKEMYLNTLIKKIYNG